MYSARSLFLGKSVFLPVWFLQVPPLASLWKRLVPSLPVSEPSFTLCVFHKARICLNPRGHHNVCLPSMFMPFLLQHWHSLGHNNFKIISCLLQFYLEENFFLFSCPGSLIGSPFDSPVSCPVLVHSLIMGDFHELWAQIWNQKPGRASLSMTEWLQ